MLPWKLRKRQILPVSQNLSSVYFSLAKFQLVSCNLSLAIIWQMTYTQKLPKLCSATLKVLELMALFLLKTETCNGKNSWEFFVDNIIRFRKERDKYKVSLINRNSFIPPRIQHKVLVLRTVFAVCFWLLSFLQLKLWARIYTLADRR